DARQLQGVGEQGGERAAPTIALVHEPQIGSVPGVDQPTPAGVAAVVVVGPDLDSEHLAGVLAGLLADCHGSLLVETDSGSAVVPSFHASESDAHRAPRFAGGARGVSSGVARHASRIP
ncbi:hypothetical protein CMI37_21385, partial [Candidatus Pacearchaeota archaeon]|nr:hypothetical protein [Candidatus Pacearchaeota archaeon]